MIVTIGGNIGCGKSTLLNRLNPKYTVVPEPVNKWGSWLDLFYSDMKRYGLGFQMKVLYEFLCPEDNTITERCPLDALYVFGKALVQSDILTHMEYNLFSDYVHKIGWTPNVYVYLRADPQVCFERIQKRSRNAENGVTLDYIIQIHNRYEKFIETLNDIGVSVYTVNANYDPDKVIEAVNTLLFSIM
jgi:deoxyadenosine/deoxycytidine kinase